MRPLRLAWRLSPQVYAWRVTHNAEAEALGLPAFLAAGAQDAADAGYDGLEFGASVLAPPGRVERTAELLARRGLALAALFATGRLESPPEALLEIVRQAIAGLAAGCTLMNVATQAATQGDPRSADPDDLAATIRLLADLGPRLADQGVHLCWHPHEEHLRDGGGGLRTVLDATASGHVSVCLDLGWVARAGEDPVALLQACNGRLRMAHLRDVQGGTWAQAVGEGDLDLAAICAELPRHAALEWASVELWFERDTAVTRSLAENAQVSLAAFRSGEAAARPRRRSAG